MTESEDNWWLALQRRPLAYRAVLTIATMGSAILAYSCLSSDRLTMRGGHILRPDAEPIWYWTFVVLGCLPFCSFLFLLYKSFRPNKETSK
jgi:hypothetical protein